MADTSEQITIQVNGKLQAMLDEQRAFQILIGEEKGGGDPAEKCNPHYLRDMKDALESELDELQNETGWKPWASSRHVNIDAARSEWIDAWHFMMNLALALGMDEEMIFDMYVAKLKKNVSRHESGTYDGIRGKCPKCKRAYDDDAVTCYPADKYPGGMKLAYCDVYNEQFSPPNTPINS